MFFISRRALKYFPHGSLRQEAFSCGWKLFLPQTTARTSPSSFFLCRFSSKPHVSAARRSLCGPCNTLSRQIWSSQSRSSLNTFVDALLARWLRNNLQKRRRAYSVVANRTTNEVKHGGWEKKKKKNEQKENI